jgi:hypothetical protein
VWCLGCRVLGCRVLGCFGVSGLRVEGTRKARRATPAIRPVVPGFGLSVKCLGFRVGVYGLWFMV